MRGFPTRSDEHVWSLEPGRESCNARKLRRRTAKRCLQSCNKTHGQHGQDDSAEHNRVLWRGLTT